MIRDTSHQDAVITAPKGQHTRRRLAIAAGIALLLAAGYYLVHTLSLIHISEATRPY